MQILDGEWKLATDAANRGRAERWFSSVREAARDTPVPGAIQQVFPDYHGVAWYWHTFRPTRTAAASERYLLRFGIVCPVRDTTGRRG